MMERLESPASDSDFDWSRFEEALADPDAPRPAVKPEAVEVEPEPEPEAKLEVPELPPAAEYGDADIEAPFTPPASDDEPGTGLEAPFQATGDAADETGASTPDAEVRPEPAAASAAGALTIDGLRKSFKGRPVVKGVSLSVRRGEVVGLLGPNGAGKTTCFYMITGLIAADAGTIHFDGHDIAPLPMYRRARLGIGYLPQEPSIFRGLTVEENIRAVLEVVEPNRRKRMRELDSLLDEFAITRLRKSPAIALSGGERRRVEIARALASRPSFMLLDEPFAGIDPIAVGGIRTLVRHLTQRGIGVLITDHNVRETLGLIDRAYIIHDGAVLMEGSPEEVTGHADVRRFYLGEEFSL